MAIEVVFLRLNSYKIQLFSFKTTAFVSFISIDGFQLQLYSSNNQVVLRKQLYTTVYYIRHFANTQDD